MRISPPRVFTRIISAFSSLVFLGQAAAMTVEPMSLDMAAGGKAARHSIKVSNPGAKPLPVEITTARLELGPNGEQTTRPSTEDFLIYPAQAMIPPGASQVFRVQWIGDPGIEKSQTYRFSISQVPVKLPEGVSGIQIVMNFAVTVNVAPLQGTSDIVVTSAAPVAGQNGKRLAAVTVRNSGNIHALLQKSSIRLSGGSWSAEMSPGEIAQKVGLGIVQPGKERRFVLPVEVPGNISKIDAVVTLRPEG